MVRTNHKMAMLLDTAKVYDDKVIEQVCYDILSKIKQVGDCIVYDECNALDSKTNSEEEITKRYGDRTGFEIWYNEIRLSRYKNFNIGYILPFLDAIKHKMKTKYPRLYCYVIYVTETQDIDFRFHVYREEEGMWLDDNIEEETNPLLYDLDFEQVTGNG